MPDIITVGVSIGVLVGLYIAFNARPPNGYGKKFYGSFAKLRRFKG